MHDLATRNALSGRGLHKIETMHGSQSRTEVVERAHQHGKMEKVLKMLMCSVWCHKNHLQRGCHAFRAKNFFFIYRCLLCHLTSTPDPIELLSRFQRRMPHQATTNLAQIFEVRTLQYNPENQVSRLKASKSMEYTVKLNIQ